MNEPPNQGPPPNYDPNDTAHDNPHFVAEDANFEAEDKHFVAEDAKHFVMVDASFFQRLEILQRAHADLVLAFYERIKDSQPRLEILEGAHATLATEVNALEAQLRFTQGQLDHHLHPPFPHERSSTRTR